MYLMFMRHGKAEEKKPGMSDEERHLTDEGRRDIMLVSKALPLKPSIVYSSPLVRAVETAEIVAGTHEVSLKIADELRPELTSLNSIIKIKPPDQALLVGHAPSIERVVSELIGGGNVKLKAGAVAGIELSTLEAGKGVLRFILTPDIARKCFE